MQGLFFGTALFCFGKIRRFDFSWKFCRFEKRTKQRQTFAYPSVWFAKGKFLFAYI